MARDPTLFEELTDSAPEPITILGRMTADDRFQLLHEGRWIDGRYKGNIRIDRNTHFAAVDGEGVHAHVYGRRDRDNALVAVNLDGTKSHGLNGRLHTKDAEALRRQGFRIPAGDIVETLVMPSANALFLNEAIQAGPVA